jgi:uncharacterized protein
MFRILLFGLIIYLGYRFFRNMVGIQTPRDREREVPGQEQADLVKDPQCGTYFLKRHGVRAVVEGEELFFCSRQCRDQYLQARRSS